MGAALIVIPNACDYWLQILNPCQQILRLSEQFESQIIQEVKIMAGERWVSLKVASVLLLKILKEEKTVTKMLEDTHKRVFVTKCAKESTLNPELYELLQKQCLETRSIDPENEGETKIFGFQKAGSIADIRTSFEELQTKEIDKLPATYLLLQLKDTYTISIVNEGKSQRVFESPISQLMILKLIKQAVSREFPDEVNYTLQSLLNQIFEDGNSEKADLLVQDIFGSDKCGIIGLPPKLIASSLAKFAKEEKVSSTIWDQVQSVLVAFALNIGILAKEQIFLTKIPKVVFKTSEIASKQFLSVINTLLSPHGEIIFIKYDIPEILSLKENSNR